MTRRSAAILVTGAVLFAAGCSNDGSGPPSPSLLEVVGGDAQADTVGRTLAIVYVVRVRNPDSTPAAGVTVVWEVTGGAGTITPTSASDGAGLARAIRTLGIVAGPQTATATVGGASVTFTAAALPAAPAALVKNGGDAQQGPAATPLPVPFSAVIQDQYANPVAGVTVNWSVTAGGGALSVVASTTDGTGTARTTLTLGDSAGPNEVSATVAGVAGSLTFTATAIVQPVLVTTLPIPQNYGIHDTFVRDGLAFVSAWNTGVLIYDVGNGIRGGSPANPVLVDSLATAGGRVHNAWWFHNPTTTEKRYLFLGEEGPGAIGATSSGDIHVVDVSDLANIQEVAFFRLPGAGTHNFWMDEANLILYAAYYNGGVVALDVSGALSGDLASRMIDTITFGASNTYTWSVQLYNGSLYATDMLSGLWQLNTSLGTLSVANGGGNEAGRFSSDLWVANGYAYTGTWDHFRRTGLAGSLLKVWHLDGTGVPVARDSILVTNVGAVSDVEVSPDGKLLMFSTESGTNAGFWFYSLADPARPSFIANYLVGSGVHTATLARIGGRLYAFGAKNPNGAALIILDVTSLDP
ncbi:MAG: Ig-like domain-containing protein [Gemmatimonadales bacterium]